MLGRPGQHDGERAGCNFGTPQGELEARASAAQLGLCDTVSPGAPSTSIAEPSTFPGEGRGFDARLRLQ
jgi:hypothetical protein